jgi:hypothetical protein
LLIGSRLGDETATVIAANALLLQAITAQKIAVVERLGEATNLQIA